MLFLGPKYAPDPAIGELNKRSPDHQPQYRGLLLRARGAKVGEGEERRGK